MKAAEVVSKEDIVLYKKLDGTYEAYKALSVNRTSKGFSISLQIISERGTLGSKRFTTQLIGKKNGGKQRVFRCWLQLGDKVIIKETHSDGIVQNICNSSGYKSVVVDITENSTGRLFEYTLVEAVDKIDLID